MVQLSCTDPQFLFYSFSQLLKVQADHPLVKILDLQNEAQLSYLFELSAVQESFRFRALSRARSLALALVDEKGEIKQELLNQLIPLYEKEGAIFYPTGQNDSMIYEQITRFLPLLNTQKILRSLKRFQQPLCHKWAEKLVLETLGIYQHSIPTDSQIRAAVICACLTPLRQNVGSCFATAPAILIQKEQVELLIDDLYQLLSTGKLKRTFGGVEYAIPLSPSTGIGDLKKNLLANDAKAHTGFCPGLMAAMESIGVLPSNKNLQEQGEKLEEMIQLYAAGKSPFTVEDFICNVLLKKMKLTAEDVEKAHEMEMAQFKRSRMALGAPDPGLSRRLEQVHSFQEKEKAARSVFKGICDNALLKAWEFTLASFSEVKMEFSRWNLYSSLGLSAEEPGGISQVIYQIIDEKIQAINRKLAEYQTQYEIAFDQVRATETLLRNASSEGDARRLQAEYQSRAYHMRACLDLRDETYSKGSHFSHLFPTLIKFYDQKFPEYFQEIYDAEMQDFQGNLYDDSPAGFRLVYKHGRTDPSLWTLIYTPEQYIETLLDFFSVTEAQAVAACEWEEGEREVLELISAIINHIRTQTFLETALQRMARAHQFPAVKSPLSHLQSLEKKPWAYTSGGTLTTLLKTYYRRESEFTHEEKWVENESELLIFILDVLKNLPPRISDPFVRDPQKMMLINSPSHAFLLLPGQEILRQGWQEEIFTYTWVRDQIFLPNQEFYAQMKLNPVQQNFLLSAFSEQLPPLLAHGLTFFSDKNLSIREWRQQILEIVTHSAHATSKQKKTIASGLDAFLYQMLPLVPGKDWKFLIRQMFKEENLEQILSQFPDEPRVVMSAREIKEIAKGCYLLAKKAVSLSFDLHQFVADRARHLGLGQPTPLFFADTNWTNYFFGFVVNPGTMRFELWRLDKTLTQGLPMSEWKHYLDGSERKAWTIFNRPSEYSHR